jgi:hypothetical protein
MPQTKTPAEGTDELDQSVELNEAASHLLAMIIPQIRLLTDELRGRPEAPDQSRGRTLSSRARGETIDVHGPLQRLLEVMPSNAPLRWNGGSTSTTCSGIGALFARKSTSTPER